MILAPDQHQRSIFADSIKDKLTEGKTLAFAHGFNIRFGYIDATEGVDVILVAPKAPGHTVRREYVAGRGIPDIIAVERDASGSAWDTALSYARPSAAPAPASSRRLHRRDRDRPLRRAGRALRWA